MEIVQDFDVRSLLHYMGKVHLNKKVKVIVQIFSKNLEATSEF
jgi:hypothetical protein